MKDSQIRKIVDESIELDRDIQAKLDMLKGLKGQLIAEAMSRPDEQVATDGGGWSVTFEGGAGNVCRVTVPGDALKASIDGEGRAIEKVREAAGSHFSRLFLQATKWKLVPNFRDEAMSLLGKTASKLIRLCSKSSVPSVSFETKELAAIALAVVLPFLGGCYTPSETERQTFLQRQIAIQQVRSANALERIAAALEKRNPETPLEDPQ